MLVAKNTSIRLSRFIPDELVVKMYSRVNSVTFTTYNQAIEQR